MKVSLNWVKEFTDVDISVDELVAKIGAQLGAVEEVIDLGKKYQGIVIAKVVACEKHPNADKLSLCMIDDGGKVQGVERDGNGHVQVVCGAPNVREGLLVAWLPPGSTVPSTYDKDPFVLEARELRGKVSNGMIASAKELAIGDDHSGIVEIDYECLPGADFAETYKLNDYIIDIENKMFTHRPDCFGILGVAREIAGIQGKQFTSPEWYLDEKAVENLSPKGPALELRVTNELPELVPRFMAVTISEVVVRPSLFYIQTFLSRVGIRPINNIVDFTNYYMYLTGQPLHAYDYDKVAAKSSDVASLVVRYPKKGEKLTLLGGKVIEPREEAIMIATDKEPIGLGGVMGGADTEVDENTKNVILECANFDMYSIRRTSMHHGLFTDAVTRFNKGQSPLQNDKIIAVAGQEICNTGTGGFGPVFDDSHVSQEQRNTNSLFGKVSITPQFISNRLGLQLDGVKICEILKNVEFGLPVVGDNAQEASLEVFAPFWRTDIEIPEDVVEEVGRLIGYDKMPLDLPKRTLTPTKVDEELAAKKQIRSTLAKLGANEVMTYSFVHGDLFAKTGQDKDEAFQISNALSPDLQYYRLSLTPSLLNHVHTNIKAGHDRFALFEIGKVHGKSEIDEEEKVPREFGRVALVVADKKDKTPAFYTAKAYLRELSHHNFTYIPVDVDMLQGHRLMSQMIQPFNLDRSALVMGPKYPVGIVGEYKPEVARALKLPRFAAGFEVFLSALKGLHKSKYQPLSRYPSVTQDICFEVASNMSFGALTKSFTEALKGACSEHERMQWEPLDIYASEDLAGKKRFTYRVVLASYERTLTDDALSNILSEVAQTMKKENGAERI